MGKPLSQFEVYPFPFASASTKSELKLELQPPHVRFVPKADMPATSILAAQRRPAV
jgi:hypothetical protein